MEQLLLDEVEVLFIFEDFVEFDDIGVVEFAKDLDFSLEGFRILDVLFGDDLDHTVLVRSLNHPPEVDNAISASAQRLS